MKRRALREEICAARKQLEMLTKRQFRRSLDGPCLCYIASPSSKFARGTVFLSLHQQAIVTRVYFISWTLIVVPLHPYKCAMRQYGKGKGKACLSQENPS